MMIVFWSICNFFPANRWKNKEIKSSFFLNVFKSFEFDHFWKFLLIFIFRKIMFSLFLEELRKIWRKFEKTWRHFERIWRKLEIIWRKLEKIWRSLRKFGENLEKIRKKQKLEKIDKLKNFKIWTFWLRFLWAEKNLFWMEISSLTGISNFPFQKTISFKGIRMIKSKNSKHFEWIKSKNSKDFYIESNPKKKRFIEMIGLTSLLSQCSLPSLL